MKVRTIVTIGLVVLVCGAVAAGLRPHGPSSAVVAPDLPVNHVTITNTAWRKGGFGAVAFAAFSLKNDNPASVKDVEIECGFFGKSGTQISTASTTIYDVILPKTTKTFPELSLGFVGQQAVSASCLVAGVR